MTQTREMGVEAARRRLGDLVERAARHQQITVLTSHRMPAAAIVPLDLLRALAGGGTGLQEYRQAAAEALGSEA